jgi:hypothetical protein
MTMLYSLYAAEGIVFAADSRIKVGAKGRAPSQRKVLRVGRVGPSEGLIGYYGLAQVGGEPMSSWLAKLISTWPGSRDPEDFADLVVDGLNRDTFAREQRHVSGLHFGAFRRSHGRFEPVFFHIFNTTGFEGGVHTNPGNTWHCEEQLMGRDVARMNWDPARVRWHLRERQRVGMPHWYRNGDLPVFGPVTTFLEVAVSDIVHLRGYAAPTSIAGWARIGRVLVVTTAQLARAFHKGPVPTIGDEARVLTVEWPASGL